MGISETETIIKKVLPYLERRGYDINKDLQFEESTILEEGKKGFIDILVTLGKKTPVFLIEAKRNGTKVSAAHRKQAIGYGKSKGCLFVAITNGQYFELINTTTTKPLKLNGTACNKLHRKIDLSAYVIPQLKKDIETSDITIPTDKGLPFRPGMPLTKLNHLIQQCHNSIRKIEKNEDYVFADFSKILFLKLLEEKWDRENTNPLYTFCFHELAETPPSKADQVKIAINSMISTIKMHVKYSAVLSDPLKLKNDATYLAIVRKIASVSWNDCNIDSKGTAFEYFVRATLKGKKLGQYFTPRPLVQLMLHLGRYKQILENLKANLPFKVLDPACGTGGFLVFAMNQCLSDVALHLSQKDIHENLSETLIKKLKEETFFGIDAHEGIASSAKMNMIIAGDGHNNIECKDSLKEASLVPLYTNATGGQSDKAHLILANPPFGTSEKESLSEDELLEYDVKSTKGQSLFIQKMVSSTEDDSLIVTVIDEGVLNTFSHKNLRKHLLQECRIEYIVSLPDETFKPNKINVKSSVLVLKKRKELDDQMEDDYPIVFVKIESLGYDGAGNELRHFELNKLITEIEGIDPRCKNVIDKMIKGYNWVGFIVQSKFLASDLTNRFDYKYWDVEPREKISSLLKTNGCRDIKGLNQIPTRRGNSPAQSEYVSEDEGFALVVKAGSNISKTGLLNISGDYIEEAVYQLYKQKGLIINEGDILLSSTGDGTLGKCCVYRNKKKPAIADSHVTVLRVDKKVIYPEYLCDYTRKGFGANQINRLYTGSTGLIELTPEDVDKIIIPPLPKIDKQKIYSKALRKTEEKTKDKINQILLHMKRQDEMFHQQTIDG